MDQKRKISRSSFFFPERCIPKSWALCIFFLSPLRKIGLLEFERNFSESREEAILLLPVSCWIQISIKLSPVWTVWTFIWSIVGLRKTNGWHIGYFVWAFRIIDSILSLTPLCERKLLTVYFLLSLLVSCEKTASPSVRKKSTTSLRKDCNQA